MPMASLPFTGFESFLLQALVLLWVLVEIVGVVVIPRLGGRGGPPRHKDERSDLSTILLRVSLYASVLVAILLVLKRTAMLPDGSFYPGIALMAIGMLVRLWAVLVLGRFFTLTIGVQKDQKLVDRGPYRLIRHPSYLGLLLIAVGIGMALKSWGGTVAIIVLFGAALAYRIHTEERFLVAELGDDYLKYMKRTKRIIPYVL
jgi:protein-S-isoprenylcysteine O-methyltransferase Ste14